MRTSMEHLEAAISEVEAKVTAGRISLEEAEEAIRKLRIVHQRLLHLEEKLLAGPKTTS